MRVRTVVAALALTLGAGVAHAQLLGPSPYLSFADSPFSPLSFGYFHNETFEDGALNTPGLSASGGRILAPGASTDSVDADDGAINGSGAAGHSWYSNQTLQSLTFSFSATALGQFPTHAGLVWTDVGQVTAGAFATGPVTFEAFDALGVSLGAIGPVTLGDGFFTGETAEDRFFGVINAGGISAIRISMSNSTDWEVDHVQYGFIPTPGSVGLLALAGLAAARRRRA